MCHRLGARAAESDDRGAIRRGPTEVVAATHVLHEVGVGPTAHLAQRAGREVRAVVARIRKRVAEPVEVPLPDVSAQVRLTKATVSGRLGADEDEVGERATRLAITV